MNFIRVPLPCIAILVVAVSVPTASAQTDEAFRIDTPQDVLISSATRRVLVPARLFSADERHVIILAPYRDAWGRVGLRQRKYRAGQIHQIQTADDVYEYNPARRTFESWRVRAREQAGELWIDTRQAAEIKLASGVRSDGELVLLSAKAVWFRSWEYAFFKVIAARDIRTVTTPTASYVYDFRGGGLRTAKENEETPAGPGADFTATHRQDDQTVQPIAPQPTLESPPVVSLPGAMHQADSAAPPASIAQPLPHTADNPAGSSTDSMNEVASWALIVFVLFGSVVGTLGFGIASWVNAADRGESSPGSRAFLYSLIGLPIGALVGYLLFWALVIALGVLVAYVIAGILGALLSACTCACCCCCCHK